MAGTEPPTRVDLDSPVVQGNPYELYARWCTTEPVRRGPLGEWYLTRYDDVAMVLGDPARFSSSLVDTRLYEEVLRQLRIDAADSVFNVVTHPSMIRVDPPDHTRLRKLVNKAFTPRAVERLRPRIEQIAHELLDPVDTGAISCRPRCASAFASPACWSSSLRRCVICCCRSTTPTWSP